MKIKIFFVLLCTVFCCSASDFNEAIKLVLRHEGVGAADLKDGAGYTRYGISLRYLEDYVKNNPERLSELDFNHDKIINKEDIIGITQEKAIALYKRDWWDKNKYGSLINPHIAHKLFDIAVNVGNHRAVLFLQKSYNQLPCMTQKCQKIKENGKLDTESIQLINSLSIPCSNKTAKIFKEIAKQYYIGLSNRRPEFSRFIKGWINRVED